MIQALTTLVLNIINSIFCLWNNKAKNEELMAEDRANKYKDTQDKANGLISDALNGNKEALDELRKRIS
jgi:hypothetical protein